MLIRWQMVMIPSQKHIISHYICISNTLQQHNWKHQTLMKFRLLAKTLQQKHRLQGSKLDTNHETREDNRCTKTNMIPNFPKWIMTHLPTYKDYKKTSRETAKTNNEVRDEILRKTKGSKHHHHTIQTQLPYIDRWLCEHISKITH